MRRFILGMSAPNPRAIRPSRWLSAIAVVIGLLVTACSSRTSGARSTSSVSSPIAASSQVTSTSPAPSSSAATSTITQNELDAALLATSDIGPGFKLGTYQPDQQGGVCEPPGTPSVDQRVPPQFAAGRSFDSTTVTAQLTQSAAIYTTPAQAARAFALAVRGTSCRHGTLSDGTKITISRGQDVTSQVNAGGVGHSTAWQISSAQLRGVIVATLAGRVANACIFVAAANVDTTKLPNPVAIAKIAFHKLLTH